MLNHGICIATHVCQHILQEVHGGTQRAYRISALSPFGKICMLSKMTSEMNIKMYIYMHTTHAHARTRTHTNDVTLFANSSYINSAVKYKNFHPLGYRYAQKIIISLY